MKLYLICGCISWSLKHLRWRKKKPAEQPALGLCGVPEVWTAPASPAPSINEEFFSEIYFLPSTAPSTPWLWPRAVGGRSGRRSLHDWLHRKIFDQNDSGYFKIFHNVSQYFSMLWVFETFSFKQPLEQLHCESSSPITERATFNPHSLRHLVEVESTSFQWTFFGGRFDLFTAKYLSPWRSCLILLTRS